MIVVDTDKQLRPYQKDYYDALIYLEEKAEQEHRAFHTLVAIPTGGGKTRLAVCYAINRALAQGKKVLWLAHSQFLLDQAYQEFRKYLEDDTSNFWETACILSHSGESSCEGIIPSPCEAITPEHKLIVASSQGLLKCREDKLQTIGDALVIVDEAHHTAAPGFLRMLQNYTRTRDQNVIGLTATPVRSNEAEKRELYGFYRDTLPCKNPVHLITMLEEKEYLVPPQFDTIFVPGGDRSVSDQGRGVLNRKILETYRNSQTKYGKTVIAAKDIQHVDELYSLFEEELSEVPVFRVYSGMPGKESCLQAFRESRNGVLLYVNMLNEGVDIPDIQTIFLARPMDSLIQVTQITGRAMRQNKSRTKEYAYIVNFAVSDLQHKILFVMPNVAYAAYVAQWNGEEGRMQAMQAVQKYLERAREMVDKLRGWRMPNISLFAVCLVGFYRINDPEEEELLLPVGIQDYRALKKYIEDRDQGKQGRFPRELAFCDAETAGAARRAIDRGGGACTEFYSFDEQLLKHMDKMMDAVCDIYRNSKNDTVDVVVEKLTGIYCGLEDDVKAYLKHVGIDRRQSHKLVGQSISDMMAEASEKIGG